MKVIGTLLFTILLTTATLYSQQPGVDHSKRKFTNTLGMEFELIKPGSMIVGRVELTCPTPPDTREVDERVRWTEEDFKRCEELARRDSRPGFMVTIEKPYYLGKYEVTQGQWKKVMGTNPSFFQGNKVESNADQHPVDNVSWEQAQAFIKRLNALDTTAVYRLPTEFEWEYAARAGASELLSWAETKEQAWIQDTDKGSTQPVGQMKSNPWGLYDMLGNVWEWVEDYYNDKVYPSPVPPASGEVHVLRGGSFISDVVNATYFFHAGGPGNGYDVGFRVVREAK
jgi:sulfatase modifying factor 1